MTSRKWSISFLVLVLITLSVLGSVIVVIDPFFHYHAPLSSLQYMINSERYQNDGIAKHFSYDAIITGTSMTENFKASEFDRLFSCNTIKIPLSGSPFKETRNLLNNAIEANPDLIYVVRSVDGNNLLDDKDFMRTDAVYPDYLYNDFLLDDVNYIFNKEVLLLRCKWVLDRTASGAGTTNFDECYSWAATASFGRDAVIATYERHSGTPDTQGELTDANREIIKGTIQQNFIDMAEENPQIQFYLFFPPYSILQFDQRRQQGRLEETLQLYEYAAELLLSQDNIHLFNFFDDFSLICDLDHYRDIAHHDPEVNSEILRRMKDGRNQLTQENFREVFSAIHEFYTTYDYDALFTEG